MGELVRDVLESEDVPHEFGHREDHGLDVDCAIDLDHRGVQFAFQLQGAPSRRKYLTQFRNELLDRLGWNVKEIDLKQWDSLPTDPDQQLNFKLRFGRMVNACLTDEDRRAFR